MDLALDAFDLTPDAVRQRFEWASRRGHPTWLWPNVAVKQWNEALARIEMILRAVLTNESTELSLDGHSDAIGVACYTSGVGPLLGFWNEQGVFSASSPVAAVLKLHLRHNRLRMERMTGQAVDLAEAFSARGIAVTLLKGIHTAHAYFPEPGTRPASDIDVLIDGSDEEAASDILLRLRYQRGVASRWPPQCSWRLHGVPAEPRTLCFLHADDPRSVDLQTSLNRRHSDGAPMARLDNIVHTASWGSWPVLRSARVLAQPLLLLELAVHASCGLHALNLLRLVELIFVIRQDTRAGLLSWPEFLAIAEKAGAVGLVHLPLRLCEQLAPGTVPADVLATCEQQVPASVRQVVDNLRPADAQRVVRCSLAERFMWTPSRTAMVRQVFLETFPSGVRSPSAFVKLCRKKFWRLSRRSVTR